MAKKLGIDGDIFNDLEMHVHVPQGAIPKTGLQQALPWQLL